MVLAAKATINNYWHCVRLSPKIEVWYPFIFMYLTESLIYLLFSINITQELQIKCMLGSGRLKSSCLMQ